jgi:hypothetical protein
MHSIRTNHCRAVYRRRQRLRNLLFINLLSFGEEASDKFVAEVTDDLARGNSATQRMAR